MRKVSVSVIMSKMSEMSKNEKMKIKGCGERDIIAVRDGCEILRQKEKSQSQSWKDKISELGEGESNF